MPKDDCPDPPYETIVGICSLSIRKTDRIMRVLGDDGTSVDVNVGRLSGIPARKGDRVGVAAVPIRQGFYQAVYCRNLETSREFFWVPIKSGCYIATMIYSQYSYEVKMLRVFRDNFLSTGSVGSIIVRIYYCVSPKVIQTRGIQRLKPLVKASLDTFLLVLRRSNTFRDTFKERGIFV